MIKRMLAILLALVMMVCVSGCTAPNEVWVSEVIVVTGNNKGDTNQTERTRKTTKGDSKQTTAQQGIVTRPPKSDADLLDFTPVPDAGADYNIKGEVSIAVDTVRPTDYEALFDTMQKLYPNINFTFDYWTHATNDDAREYLTTKMKTQTAANIMWDEAGMIPMYLYNGWIKPITSYVAKDPEAKNIPANLKNDYTYYGELFAVPHQATFETVVFNTDLLSKINLGLPKLEWSLDDYEQYLRKAGDNFNNGTCVGLNDQDGVGDRLAFYLASAAGKKVGTNAYNYATQQFEVDYLREGYKLVRSYRLLPGAEAWQQEQQKTGGVDLLEQNLGVGNYYDCWRTGKALMRNCGSWIVETEMKNTKNFKWKMWTTPNVKGKMMMHVDHCFITSLTPDDRMDACYQALRFMTFSTNGNLARLTMYEDSQKDKYNLNSHVYYPTTQNAEVIKKFNALSRTNEVDEYLVKNIPNSSRTDTFKLVYSIQDTYSVWTDKMNDITDGLDASGSNLNEPVDKANKEVKENLAAFEKAFKKNYK